MIAHRLASLSLAILLSTALGSSALRGGDCLDPTEVPDFPDTIDLSEAEDLLASVPCLDLPLPGAEAVLRLVVPSSGKYRTVIRSLDGSNVALIAGEACPPAGEACLAAADEYGAGQPEVLILDLIAGDTLDLIVAQSALDEADSLGRVELRFDAIGPADRDRRPTRVQLPNDNALPFVTDAMEDVWEVGPNGDYVVGDMTRTNQVAVASAGLGVSSYAPPPPAGPPERGPKLRFDRFRYSFNAESVTLELTIPGVAVTGTQEVVVATGSGDAEKLTLNPAAGEWSGSLPIEPDAPAEPEDGLLSFQPGEILIGLWQDPDAVDHPIQATSTAVALVEGGQGMGNVVIEIDPEVEPVTPETEGRIPGEEPRPLGAIADDQGVFLMLGVEEIVVDSRDGELEKMLTATGGRVIDDGQAAGQNENPFRLLRFDPELVDPERAAQSLELLGANGTLRVSDERTLALLAFVAEARLRNFDVSANWILTPHGQPESFDEPFIEDGATRNTDIFKHPGSRTGRNALGGIQRAWVYNSIFDKERDDRGSLRVAVIDSNFCEDLREDCSIVGGFDFYNYRPSPFGRADNFGISAKYHGSKTASIIGGIHSNGVGAGGTGGQVADLLLYNVGGLMFYFDAASATFAGIANGASVINMSFGFPCAFAGLNWCDPVLGGLTCAILGPIFDIALAAAQTLIPIPLPPLPPGAACITVLGFLSSSNAALTTAILSAHAANVSVVASAGNRLGPVPPSPVELFHIVPAMIPGVIVVGVCDRDFQNTEFFGPRVDVWVENSAPTWEPDPNLDDCSGFGRRTGGQSSGGAAVVSGILAMMRGINPLVPAVAFPAILRANTVFAPGGDALVMGYLRSDRALWTVGRLPGGGLPDPTLLSPLQGFDEFGDDLPPEWRTGPGAWLPTSLGQPGDTPATAVRIPWGTALGGTWTREDAAVHSYHSPGRDLDPDWYEIPGGRGLCVTYDLTIELDYFTAGGDLTLDVRDTPDSVSTSGPITTATFLFPDQFLDAPFRFLVGGEDNYYRMRVSVREDPRLRVDDLEPNDTREAAHTIPAGDFVTDSTSRTIFHRANLPELTLNCADDEDWFFIQLPPADERCERRTTSCGLELPAGVEANVIVSAAGNPVELFDRDGVPIPTRRAGEIVCPRSNGYGLIYARVANPGVLSAYNLRVNYVVPRPDGVPDWFVNVVDPFVCCEYGGALCDRLIEGIDPEIVGINELNIFAGRIRDFIFRALCNSPPCGRPPAEIFAIELPERAAIDLRFSFLGEPPEGFEGALLNLDHEIIGTLQAFQGDRTQWMLTSAPTDLPPGPYFGRIRGLEPGTVFSVENLNVLEPPTGSDDYALLPRVDEDSCGGTIVEIDLEAEGAVGGFQFELSWNGDVAEYAEAQLIGAFEGFQIFADLREPGLLAFGAASLGGEAVEIDGVVTAVAFRFQAREEGSSEVCIRDVFGQAPEVTEPIITIQRGGRSESERARVGCLEVDVTGDMNPPSIVCPDDLLREPTANGELVFWTVDASDDCGPAEVVCEPPSGSEFLPGVTEVICTVTDPAGNTNECSFEVVIELGAEFRRGDVTADGPVNITDPIYLLAYLFNGGPAPFCPDSADATDDGVLNITDPIQILSFLFTGGAPPAAPGPFDCGVDPSADALPGCEYDSC